MTFNRLNLFSSDTRTIKHTICNTPAEPFPENLIVKSRSDSDQPCDALSRAWICNLTREVSVRMWYVFWMFPISAPFYFGFQVRYLSTTKLKQQADLDAYTGLLADCFYFTSFPFNFWVNQHLCSKYVTTARDAFYSHNRYERQRKQQWYFSIPKERFSTIVSISQSGAQTLVKEPRPEINSSCKLWRQKISPKMGP